MYRKILVPLDGSTDSEGVLAFAPEELATDGELILLQVISPSKTRRIGGRTLYAGQQLESARARALSYLNGIVSRQGAGPGHWRCEVTVAYSISQSIVNLAMREGVGLIAMYTHDRKGFARLIKGSIAREVGRRAPVEVEFFNTSFPAPQAVPSPGHTIPSQVNEEGRYCSMLAIGDLEWVDILRGLTPDQLKAIAAVGERVFLPAGTPIVEASETAHSVYAVLSGRVELYTDSPVGETTVRVALPGESLPLAALVGSGRLITSARVLMDAELAVLPVGALRELFVAQPEMGMKIYASIAGILAHRYRLTLHRLTDTMQEALQHVDFWANV